MSDEIDFRYAANTAEYSVGSSYNRQILKERGLLDYVYRHDNFVGKILQTGNNVLTGKMFDAFDFAKSYAAEHPMWLLIRPSVLIEGVHSPCADWYAVIQRAAPPEHVTNSPEWVENDPILTCKNCGHSRATHRHEKIVTVKVANNLEVADEIVASYFAAAPIGPNIFQDCPACVKANSRVYPFGIRDLIFVYAW